MSTVAVSARLARGLLVTLGALWAGGAAVSWGQSLLPTYPGYSQHQETARKLREGDAFTSGAINATWASDGRTFTYSHGGRAYRFDVGTGQSTDTGAAAATTGRVGRGGGRGAVGDNTDVAPPATAPDAPPTTSPDDRAGRGGRGTVATGTASGRGRGTLIPGSGGAIPGGGSARVLSTFANSPDGTHRAVSRDGNVYLVPQAGGNEIAVTTDGDLKKRVRYGMPTIVYGEELGMGSGMWWSPDSKRLAFYRFDESKVQDFYIILRQTELYPELVTDPYPKAGHQSPPVELYIYDLDTKKTVQVDVRSGKPYTDDALGYYVLRVAWTLDNPSPGPRELLFFRMNRKQNTIEACAADPATGKVRVIVRDEYLPNWVDHETLFVYLKDHNRFIWSSDRNGFRNYYLYDLSGKLITPLTQHEFDCSSLVRIDEERNVLFYMARDGDNYQKLQLHRVGLDGKNPQRLTDRRFHHTVQVSPDSRHFVDVYQTHDTPPASRVMDAGGPEPRIVTELAKSDLSRFDQLGLKKIEVFTFKTFDGSAELHGMLHFPSNFDPSKKYPLLVSVYGGPLTSALRETFATPNQLAEYGFLVASFDARSLAGRGRKFSDPFYHHMGIVEMDDQAAGVTELLKRPYLNGKVGVFGTSYGGTAAATLLMRYPDLFQAASSSSPVTDYRNYNDIYPERYNGLVSENKEGYDKATVMTYVPNLKGRLLIFYGTTDNNVHNSNAMQLIQALQRAGKSFEVQVGPDQGHTSVNQQRMMEFFIENLVLKRSE